MKVIIPVVNNENEKNSIADGFHNTECACIYNSDDDSSEWVLLSDICKNIGNLSVELKRKGINSIINDQMPLMFLRLCIDMGLRVYRAASESVDENVQLFNKQQLKPFPISATMEMSGCSTLCSTAH